MKKTKKTKIVRGKRKGPKRAEKIDFQLIGPGIVKLRKMPPGQTRLMFAVYWKNGLGVIELKGLPGPDPYKAGHLLFQVASAMARVYAGILGIPPEEAMANILVSLGDHAAEMWPDEFTLRSIRIPPTWLANQRRYTSMHYHTKRILERVGGNYCSLRDNNISRGYVEPKIPTIRFQCQLDKLFKGGAELAFEMDTGWADEGGNCYQAFILKAEYVEKYSDRYSDSNDATFPARFYVEHPEAFWILWQGPY